MRYVSLVLLGCLVFMPSGSDIKQDELTKKKAMQAYFNLPLSFIKNEGQVDKSVYYYVKQPMQTTYLTKDSIVFDLFEKTTEETAKRQPVRFKLAGVNKETEIMGLDELPGKVNYFIGNDPSKWKTDMSTCKTVIYKDIYDGIDLKVYGNGKKLETEYIVKPHADPSKIVVRYDGIKGLKMDDRGELLIDTALGELRESRPYVYQEKDGGRVIVKASYRIISNDSYTFDISSYDRRSPLVIDPSISYAVRLGGSSFDNGYAIAIDSAGAAYVTGCTWSSDFPTVSAFDSTHGSIGGSTGGLGIDAFVTKINPEGSAIIYSTYLGGDQGIHGKADDLGYGIAVDSTGAACITGVTEATNFPRVLAIDNTFGGYTEAFVTKISPEGSALVYSTYLGGSKADIGYAIALDSTGACYATGRVDNLSGFPITSEIPHPSAKGISGTGQSYTSDTSPVKPSFTYTPIGPLTKESIYFDASSTTYDPSVTIQNFFWFFGDFTWTSGTTATHAYTKAGSYTVIFSVDYVDSSGRFRSAWAYATITVYSSSMGGGTDVFITKINANGSLGYSTYIGGRSRDIGFGIAVDSAGAAYLTGFTMSNNFPALLAFDSTLGGSIDAFVAKINPSGSALVYSTYLGGSDTYYTAPDGRYTYRSEVGRGIAVDSAGNAYVTGMTASADFPTKSALDDTLSGNFDAFVTKINTEGALVYSTYLGGNDLTATAGTVAGGYDTGNSTVGEIGLGIAVDSMGAAYVTGLTLADDFPTILAFDSTATDIHPDAFVTKINPTGSSLAYSTYLGGSSWESGYGIAVDRTGAAYVAGETSSNDFPATLDLTGWQPVDVHGTKIIHFFIQADFTYSPLDPMVREMIYFDASSTRMYWQTSEYIAYYRWDFGEGRSGNGIAAEHVYRKEGSYTVTLYVGYVDASGKIQEVSTSKTITVYADETGNEPAGKGTDVDLIRRAAWPEHQWTLANPQDNLTLYAMVHNFSASQAYKVMVRFIVASPSQDKAGNSYTLYTDTINLQPGETKIVNVARDFSEGMYIVTAQAFYSVDGENWKAGERIKRFGFPLQ